MKSIRTKLTLLLFFIALIPLLIVIVFYLMNNIASSIANEKSDGILRNSIVNEHISEHFERSLAVLRTIARNPMVFLSKPPVSDGFWTKKRNVRAGRTFQNSGGFSYNSGVYQIKVPAD